MPFVKGQKGLGGKKEGAGRPREEVRTAALKCFHALGGWDEVQRLYKSAAENVKEKILCDLLDRAYGKPTQEFTGKDGEPLIPEIKIDLGKFDIPKLERLIDKLNANSETIIE